MNRDKKLYLAVLVLCIMLVSIFYISYAVFTSNNEYSGKLNMVAGTLDYKIESIDLEDNKITIAANQIKEIKINLSSLNNISSKYELYYTINNTNDDLRVGYSNETKDSILGTIEANSKKEITIVLRNEGDTDSIVEFGVIGGLVNNELILNEGNSLNQVVGKYIAYNIGEEITLIDGSKWHVLEASDEKTDTVVLLSDYNLNSDGTYNTTCGGNINSTYTCSTMAFDPDSTSVYDETDSNNIGYFIKNTYVPLVTLSLPGTTNITLPTAMQIAAVDNLDYKIYPTLSSSWLSTTNYWTKTAAIDANSSSHIFFVRGDFTVLTSSSATFTNIFGVRPTITVPKEYIVETLDSTTSLSIGDAVTAIDGSKWHVLEASESGTETVVLLSDYNLNSDGTYNTTCGRDINSTYTCSTMAFDPNSTNKYDESDSNNIGYFIKNTYAPLVVKSLPGTTNVTLPEAKQIALADNQVFNNSGLVLKSSWILTTNYWTITPHISNTLYSWFVYSSSTSLSTNSTPSTSNSGARPVITTLKTNLLAQ